jgi:hypothetical protein
MHDAQCQECRITIKDMGINEASPRWQFLSFKALQIGELQIPPQPPQLPEPNDLSTSGSAGHELQHLPHNSQDS